MRRTNAVPAKLGWTAQRVPSPRKVHISPESNKGPDCCHYPGTSTRSRHDTQLAALLTFSRLPLKSTAYEPPSLALPLLSTFPGSRSSGKKLRSSAGVQLEKELNHEAATNPSAVSNLARTPSLDHVPDCPVCAVARPLVLPTSLQLSARQSCSAGHGSRPWMNWTPRSTALAMNRNRE
jgi:hypothetical protein